MLDEFISQSEAHGYVTSTKYYDALSDNAKKNMAELKKQRDEMQYELNVALDSGTIDRYSEAYYTMVNAIDDVTKSIEEQNSALLEYKNNIRDINWEIFDMVQDKISKVADESEFLINLMDNKKLYEDNGQLTNEGMATMGQHGVKYNTYMYQADKYAKEMQKINKELANDPYNKDLMDRRQELLEAQQEAISNAEDEKNAIKDMVEEGINKELDALQDLIDKRNDALDAEKD